MQTMLEFQASVLARADADIAGPLLGLKVDLATMPPIAITPTTLKADLDAKKADFTGYAQKTVVWNDPSLDAAGNVEVVSEPMVFRPTASTVGNQIWAAYGTLGVGGALAFAGQLDGVPIPMTSTLNQLQLQIVYKPASGTYTVVVI